MGNMIIVFQTSIQHVRVPVHYKPRVLQADWGLSWHLANATEIATVPTRNILKGPLRDWIQNS